MIRNLQRRVGLIRPLIAIALLIIATQAKAQNAKAPVVKTPANGPAKPAPSASQQIAELRSEIDSETEQLEQLKKELADLANPESDFSKTEKRFKSLDSEFKALQKKVTQLKSEDQIDVEMLAETEGKVAETEVKRKESLQAYELEIDQQKTLQEKILTIQKNIESSQHALERLTKPEETKKADKKTETSSTEEKLAQGTGEKSKPGGTDIETKKKEEGEKKGSDSVGSVRSAMTGNPMDFLNASGSKSETSKTAEKKKEAPRSIIAVRIQDQVLELEKQIETLEGSLQSAHKDESITTEMVANLEKQVELESKLRDNARKKADLANEKLSKAQEEFRVKSISDAPQAELKDMAEKLLEMDKEFQTARNESRLHSNLLQDIQNERAKKQELLRQAQQKSAELQRQIDEAGKKIEGLKDPTSLMNMVDWITTRGVRILLILITMIGSRTALRSLGSRAIRMMVQSQENICSEERNDRAETLVSVYSNAVSVGVIGGGLLLVAQEAGVPIGPLLGGAAIFGLAVAFGAQNLIKDYFYGFVILLENQFSVNDVIQVNTITGNVERITLRMTVIRDGAGTVHFVPNGAMTTVSNFSYDWSRAVFEIPFSYKSPVDEVINHIVAEGKLFRQDKEFGPLCLDDLTMLGVDNLSENSVMIKFFIKTKPLKQWPVKREMLRRLKNRFDSAEIEFQPSTKSTPAQLRVDGPVSINSNSPTGKRTQTSQKEDNPLQSF